MKVDGIPLHKFVARRWRRNLPMCTHDLFWSTSREDQKDFLILARIFSDPISDAAPKSKSDDFYLSKYTVKNKNISQTDLIVF